MFKCGCVFSSHKEKTIERFKYLIYKESLPENRKSKKLSQKVLPKIWSEIKIKSPNITITSILDDIIHYEKPRIISVRECARFLTFPDHFVFKGIRTIWSKQRAGDKEYGINRVIPQYYQAGNAVPPRLAEYLGKKIRMILK